MSRILFLNQPGMGHLNPLLCIALQMKEGGHNVHFAVPGMKGLNFKIPVLSILNHISTIPNKIKNNRIPVTIILPPLTPSFILKTLLLPSKKGYQELKATGDLLLSGLLYYTKEIIKIIDDFQPDVLVADFTFFAAYLAAEIKNIPCAVIFHSGLPFLGKNIPPFGSGQPISETISKQTAKYWTMESKVMKTLDRRMNAVMKKYRKKPLNSGILRRPYSKWLNLVLSHETMEIPRNNLDNNTFYIGPCFQKREENSPHHDALNKIEKNKYRIYLSLGTFFNNKPAVFKKIIRALCQEPFQLIISAGAAFSALTRKKSFPKAIIFKTLPQLELLPNIDLFISHGGNNSINEALSFGKPLIVIPVGGEQKDNAIKIKYLKTGLSLDLDHLTETEILDKVNEIKNNPLYQKNAMKISREIKKTDGPRIAGILVSFLAKNKRRILRKNSFPVTITRGTIHQLLKFNSGTVHHHKN